MAIPFQMPYYEEDIINLQLLQLLQELYHGVRFCYQITLNLSIELWVIGHIPALRLSLLGVQQTLLVQVSEDDASFAGAAPEEEDTSNSDTESKPDENFPDNDGGTT